MHQSRNARRKAHSRERRLRALRQEDPSRYVTELGRLGAEWKRALEEEARAFYEGKDESAAGVWARFESLREEAEEYDMAEDLKQLCVSLIARYVNPSWRRTGDSICQRRFMRPRRPTSCQ